MSTLVLKQIWLALREILSLPQTFVYFFCLLPSGRWSQHNWSVINSRWPEYPIQGIRKSIELTYHYHNPGTLVSIIQNNSVSFSFLQITYLGITQAVCSIVSTFGFWYVQKYFKIRTKNMFLCTNFFSAFIPLWEMLGLWTERIGYHHRASITPRPTYLRQNISTYSVYTGKEGNRMPSADTN